MRKFNVFEGARRISLIIWLLVCLIILSLNWGVEYHKIIYNVYTPYMEEVRRIEDNCDYEDLKKERTIFTRNSTQGNLILCFKKSDFPNGERYIPYMCNKEKSCWGNYPFSDEVEEYTENRINNYKLSAEDEKEIDDNKFEPYFAKAKTIAKYISYWTFGFYVFVSILGWIVRGFLSIPDGQDYRDDPTEMNSELS